MTPTTRASLERRLIVLEGSRDRAPPVRPFMGGTKLLVLLIAVHLGQMTKSDAMAAAAARAMGYASPRDCHDGLTAGEGSEAFADFNERHQDAVVRLLALKGVHPDHGAAGVRDALQSLFDEIPESVRQHSFARDVGASLSEALDWLCL